MSGKLILLGPQRPAPNLQEVLAELPGDGPVLTVTAGWRYDESDREALDRAIGPSAEPLPLYTWFDEIAGEAPELARVYHERQRRIQKLKELYRLRIVPALETVYRLLERQRSDPELVGPELEAAMEVVREIDDAFLIRSAAIQMGSRSQLRALETPRLARRRVEAARRILSARAVLIAGGHIGVLRNRMLFFELDLALRQALQRGVSVVAWSAGAMALSRRIVLFYDDPPEGSGHPEVLDRGLSLVRDLVVLPHARTRLRLENRDRLGTLASRFVPLQCVAMENGAWLECAGDHWIDRGAPGTASQMLRDGTLAPLEGSHA